ncbi:hypothetical protein Py04_0417 [Pyrococcus sp. ST04]|nr:hypothetical protein Py04_0417 [Pyrococcus sp. ST04]
MVSLLIILGLIFIHTLQPYLTEEENHRLQPHQIIGYAYLTTEEFLRLEVHWCLENEESVEIKFQNIKEIAKPTDMDIKAGELEKSIIIKPTGEVQGNILAVSNASKASTKVDIKVEFGSSYPVIFTNNVTTSITLYVDEPYLIPYTAEIINPTNKTIKIKDVVFPIKGVKILAFGFWNESIFSVPAEPRDLPKTMPPKSKRILVIYVLIEKEVSGLVFKPKVVLEVNGKEYALSIPEMMFKRIICKKEG